MGTKKRRPGRPRKADADQWGMPMQLRLDVPTSDAVMAYQDREGFATKSEAMRRLLRMALKAEGLL